MKLVDTHTHLYLQEFDEDRAAVMERARAAGITHLFMPNIDSTTIEPMLRLCAAYPGYAFPMMGLHPTSVGANYEEELSIVRKFLMKDPDVSAEDHDVSAGDHDVFQEGQWISDRRPSFVAVGEIGIDLYWDKTYEREQREVFARQVEWARELHLPIVIHCRNAFDAVYEILKPYQGTTLAGIFHSFTGNEGEVERMLEFERFLIGINGVVTFKKSALPALLPHIPIEKIVLETDSPYLTPVPNRGKRNESANIVYTAAKVAEAYGIPVEEVAETTSGNALSLFLGGK